MDEQNPELENEQENSGIEELNWRAPEFEYHHKKTGWYVLFVLGLAVLVAIAVLTKQWLTIGVFGVMGAALVVYANRKPKDLDYSLTDDGVSIDGKLHPFEGFQSFAVIETGGWQGVDLDPVKRLMPRVSITLESSTAAQVVEVLSAYLPRVDRDEDFVEKLSRRLKF